MSIIRKGFWWLFSNALATWIFGRPWWAWFLAIASGVVATVLKWIDGAYPSTLFLVGLFGLAGGLFLVQELMRLRLSLLRPPEAEGFPLTNVRLAEQTFREIEELKRRNAALEARFEHRSITDGEFAIAKSWLEHIRGRKIKLFFDPNAHDVETFPDRVHRLLQESGLDVIEYDSLITGAVITGLVLAGKDEFTGLGGVVQSEREIVTAFQEIGKAVDLEPELSLDNSLVLSLVIGKVSTRLASQK